MMQINTGGLVKLLAAREELAKIGLQSKWSVYLNNLGYHYFL